MRVARAVAGVTGELLLTAGVLLLLFVVWEFGYVAVTTNRAQADTVSSLERQFQTPEPGPGAAAPAGQQPAAAPPAEQQRPAAGTTFAVLRIPRLGAGWAKPVYEGVGLDVLAKGIGHYPETQLPGQVGNVALAGHRAGHGNPLLDIDTIRPGDVVVLETAAAYDVYRVVSYEIVAPTHTQVLAPVPDQPGAAPTEAWLTLTSCDPKYASTNRYVVFARLSQHIPRGQGLPADLLAAPGPGA